MSQQVKILHISDLHIEGLPARRYAEVENSLAVVRARLIAARPDLVVVTGDLTTHGSAKVEDLVLAKDWLDALDMPYLVVGGNHDLGANQSRGMDYPETEFYEELPFHHTGFAKVFGTHMVETADLGVVEVMTINIRNGDPDGTIPILQKLVEAGTKPLLIFGHYPLVNVRERGILANFGFDEFIPDSVDLLRQVIIGSSRIRVYGCGHVHANTVRALSSECLQMSAGALGPGSSTYRVLSIDQNQLHYETVIGDGPLGFWERLVVDFHEDVEYHLGAPWERSGVWNLFTS
ncbi:MAG: metallophosphoesterase family protein [Sulfobacillus sp.]